MKPTVSRALRIRAAERNEAAALTELAMRSKAHWGYDPDFMAAAQDDLAVSTAVLPQWWVWVAADEDRTLGFASLRPEEPGALELVHLFVEPDAIGRGVGTRLWRHCVREAKRRGYRRLRLTADPNAEDFYRRRGAVRVSTVESPAVRGRLLPVLEATLD